MLISYLTDLWHLPGVIWYHPHSLEGQVASDVTFLFENLDHCEPSKVDLRGRKVGLSGLLGNLKILTYKNLIYLLNLQFYCIDISYLTDRNG